MSAGSDLTGENTEVESKDYDTQEEIMNRIHDLSKQIDMYRQKYDAEDAIRHRIRVGREEGTEDQFLAPPEPAGFGRAIALQKAKIERATLLERLNGLSLAFTHPFPDTLPAPLKRTRNEVREFMGLLPITGNDN